jgi:hypothetical protein
LVPIHQLSYWITYLYDSGRVDELLTYEVLRGKTNLGPDIDEDMVILDVEDMAGLYFTLIATFIVICLCRNMRLHEMLRDLCRGSLPLGVFSTAEAHEKTPNLASFLDEWCISPDERLRQQRDEQNIGSDPSNRQSHALQYTAYEWMPVREVLKYWDENPDFREAFYMPVLNCLKDARGSLGDRKVWRDEHNAWRDEHNLSWSSGKAARRRLRSQMFAMKHRKEKDHAYVTNLLVSPSSH